LNNPAFVRTKGALAVVALLSSLAAPVHAEGSNVNAQELLNQLAKQQQQIQDLQRQVQELARQQAAPAPVASPANAMAAQPPAQPPLDPALVKLVEMPDKFRIVDNGDTTLGLYGTVEVTMNYNSTNGPYASAPSSGGNASKGWFGIDKPWLSASKWGINGTHVLDRASSTLLLVRLESEFESPTGNMDTPGVLFNRDAWIGIQSPTIGKITVGRQNTLARDVNAIWAQPNDTSRANLAETGWFDNDVIVTPKTYFESPTGSRMDASAVWKKAWTPNWITSVAYQFVGLRNDGGTDVVHNTDKSTESAVGLAYNSSDDFWHASGSFTHTKINGYDKNVYAVGANLIPADWIRLNAGLIRANIAQPAVVGSRRDTTIATSLQVNPGGTLEYILGYNHEHARNAAQDGSGTNGAGNTLAPFDATDSATFAASGNLSVAYAIGEYRWDKATTFYVAADYSLVKNGFVQGTLQGHSHATQAGAGVRYKF
jgi:predicted porin